MTPVKIIRVNNPFDYQDRTIESVPYRRQRVKNLQARFIPNVENIQIRLNGILLTPDQVKSRRLKPGDEVILIPLPEAGIGAAIATLANVLAVGGSVSINFATAASIGGAAWSIAVSVGISIGTAYIIKALGPKPDKSDPVEINPTYSWNPQTVQQQGINVPRSYGRLRKYGNIISAWTEVVGVPDPASPPKEEINLELALGTGPCEGIVANTIEIDNREIANFSGISTTERFGLMTQTAIRAATKLEYRPEREVKQSGGSYTWTTPSDDFDSIEITVAYQGHAYKNNGKQTGAFVQFKIEISEKGAESWGTLTEGTFQLFTTTTKTTWVNTGTYGGGSAQTVTKGKQYDIKITKITPDSATSQVLNTVAVVAIREIITQAFEHPGIAKLGVTALAGEEFSGRLNVSVVHDGRIINTYNGSSWTLQFSRNPAWVMWDILTRPVIDGDGGATPWSINRFDGIDPARLTPFLANWNAAASWFDDPVDDGKGSTEDRFAFNGEFQKDTNVWDAVQTVARMCRAEVIPVGRGYDIILDKIWVGDPVQLFSAANMTPGSFRQDWLPLADRAVEVNMSYLDADANYTMKPISFNNPNVGTSEKIASIGGEGITSTGQAWRMLAFDMEKNRRILSVSSFLTHVNAIVCKRGDVVNVVPPWNAAGKIVSVPDDNQIQIDNTQHNTSTNTILIRRTDTATGNDVVEEHTVSNINGDMVTIVDTWDYNPKKGDMYAFGPTAEVSKKQRIVGIISEGNFQHKIICSEYHDEIYDNDAATPTIAVAALGTPVSSGRLAALNWNQYYLQRPPSEVTEYFVDNPMPYNLTWNDNSPSGGRISWSATASGPILLDIAGATYEISPDNTDNEYVYWNPAAPTVFGSTNVFATAYIAGYWVMAINDGGTAFPANSGKILHAAVMQAGTITAARAQIANLTVDTLQIADNAVTVPVSAYTAGSIDVPVALGEIQSATIAAVSGTPTRIVFTAVLDNQDPSLTHNFERLRISRDNPPATIVWDSTIIIPIVAQGGSYVAVSFEDSPPTDSTLVYSVQMEASDTDIKVSRRSLVLSTVKK